MSETNQVSKYQKKIITIPNILSVVRLCLVPIMVFLYINGYYVETGVLLLVSGATDVVDGYIARHYNMMSDVGKVLDPAADKSTQLTVLFLLSMSFPLMLVPIILMVFKECFMLISGYMVIRKRGIVLGADWHGKAATCMLSAVMMIHLFWHDIDPTVSTVVIFAGVAMILLSLVLYAIRNFGYLFGNKQERN